MIKTKRGTEGFGMAIVVGLILIVAGIFVFSPFMKALAGVITGQGSSTACYLSLIQGEGTAKCPIDRVKISNDKVEINDENFLKKGSRSTDEMAKEALAKLLQRCLNRGGGLNSEAFKREFGLTKSDPICLECFTITIDQNIGNIRNFNTYLEDTEPKGMSPRMKYIDILTKDKTHLQFYLDFGKQESLAPSNNDFVIDSNKEYTIFFMGIKELALLGKALPYSELYLDYNDAFFTYMTESNNLRHVCKIKVN